MARNRTRVGLAAMLVLACVQATAHEARADDATVDVGERFAEPPREPREQAVAPIAVDDPGRFGPERDPREIHRAPFRLQLGPQGITTGKGLGLGVGVAADFGSGSVGGRLAASWLRGEGDNGNGTSTPTGDAIGLYGGE